jgi:hypothetical protein
MIGLPRYLSIVPAIVLFPLFANAESYQWKNTHSMGDWGDHDIGCSKGVEPNAASCNSGTEKRVAVCWASKPGCGSGLPIAWCTYKDMTMDTPFNGLAPGTVWECQYVK